MRFYSSLPLLAGLVFSSCLHAQGAPAPGAPAADGTTGAGAAAAGRPVGGGPAFARGASGPGGTPLPAVSQSARVRAFAAGPDGRVGTLYLSNGTVVSVGPDLAQPPSITLRKGARVQVSGEKSLVQGQTLIMARQLTVGGQAFAAVAPMPGVQDGRRAGIDAPPPPPAPGRGPAGEARDRGRAAMPPPPCGLRAEMGPPPPPPLEQDGPGPRPGDPRPGAMSPGAMSPEGGIASPPAPPAPPSPPATTPAATVPQPAGTTPR